MDEIAPEYDVVVLGTGGLPLPHLRNAAVAEANYLQVSRNVYFQGNTRTRASFRVHTDMLAESLVSRARRCSTSTATTTMAGMLSEQVL